MKSPERAGILWLIAAMAMLVAYLMAEPRRPFTLIAAVLFFVVAGMVFRKGRRR